MVCLAKYINLLLVLSSNMSTCVSAPIHVNVVHVFFFLCSKGDQGVMGPKGAMGLQGPRGANGVPGITGEPGRHVGIRMFCLLIITKSYKHTLYIIYAMPQYIQI